ncbi:T9SS type A sorting domain-containing protein [Bizionia sp. KMM 8389]
MNTRYLLSVCFFFILYFTSAQNYPGGVTGAEAWYISNWDDIGTNIFFNSAQNDIEILRCGETDKALFNFNPSITSEKLCLEYVAPLENTTGRNSFFVGEPYEPDPTFSHIGTLWREDLTAVALTDSIIRNFFDFNSKNLFTNEIYTDYSSDKNAHVNFYHTSNYNIDKKFKSFGQEGETVFYIGKTTLIDPEETYDDVHFNGNFPEFLSFPRELSSNERIRVESYLALKYGLTLNKSTSYLSSNNLVFWNSSNNKIFPHRIFGFGKDDVSGLNQLQSESTHLKEHLVSAIKEIMETNMEKQELVNIPNNHFLVFGDNDGKPDFVNKNTDGIKYWGKIWLAQRTGKDVEKLPIHFKLHLTTELSEYLHSNPDESLWLLQDKFISNDEVSDFNNDYIEYTEGQIDFENSTAYFKEVFFDSNKNIYDQFTFGVGPRMIIQAQVIGCKGDNLQVTLDITGGKPPYQIVIDSSQGTIEDTTNDTFYTFDTVSDITYHVTVQDANGLVVELDFTPEPWDFLLNLGPDQFLSANQPEIILNAGQGIPDPDATYEWFLDGVLLPDNESTLTVSEPGTYEVIVTSTDQSCSVSDEITIRNEGFNIVLSTINGCDEEHNALTITINGGVSPFATNLEGINGTVNYAHSGTTTITDLMYGTYIITVTDSVGDEYQDTFEFIQPIFELDLLSQLQAICNTCVIQYPNFEYPLFSTTQSFSLDASSLITSQNAVYKWYLNNVLISEDPILFFNNLDDYCYENPSPEGWPLITVDVVDAIANCYATESFYIKGTCPKDDSNPQNIASTNTSDDLSLNTKVYPNPSENNTFFTYEVSATEPFNGTVEVFTLTGAQLIKIEVYGDSNYSLPFSLQSSGVYLIRTTTSLGIVKTNRVIIK